MPCTGQCCVAFPLNITLEQLRDPEQLVGVERDYLAAMLEPISHEESVARHFRFYPGNPKELTGGVADGQYYRCAHWDEDSRLCAAYEQRPGLCRRYPQYGRGEMCEYGCDHLDILEMAEAA